MLKGEAVREEQDAVGRGLREEVVVVVVGIRNMVGFVNLKKFKDFKIIKNYI